MESQALRVNQRRDSQHATSGYVPVTTLDDPDDDIGSTTGARHSETSSDKATSISTRQGPPPLKHERRRSRVWWYIWWQSILAALLAVAAVVASFVTLYPYQGNPLPDWPFYITIGALLSTYSVVLRTAVGFVLGEGLAQLKWRWYHQEQPLYDLSLHDEASRGPLGAVLLLWRLRSSPLIGGWQWLGCVLIPVTLLVGPFTQQILRYVPCSMQVDSSIRQAAIPRASIFLSQGDLREISGITLTLAEQASINAGMFQYSGQEGVFCHSGNCTIPSYSAVGCCARCRDISSQVQVVSNDGTTLGNNPIRNTTTFIPDGLNVTYSDGSIEPSYQVHLATFGIPGADAKYGGRFGRGPSQILIGLPGVAAMDPVTLAPPAGCDDMATNQTWRCQGYGAAECSLVPCIRTYTANITNGVMQETITGEHDAFGKGTWPSGSTVAAAVQLSCLEDSDRALLRKANYTLESPTDWMAYNMTNGGNGEVRISARASNPYIDPFLLELGEFENKTAARGCMWAIQEDFADALNSYLVETASGDVTSIIQKSTASTKRLYQVTGSQLLQNIYNYGTFSFQRTESIFQNMSLSVTNHMRTTPGPTTPPLLFANGTTSPALGATFTTKTCVNVQWAWFALPIALTILTLLFFGGVMWVVSRGVPRDARTWKSSPLPLVFWGPDVLNHTSGSSRSLMGTSADVADILDTTTDTAVVESAHVEDMDAAAKQILVKLVVNKKGIAKLERVEEMKGI